MHRPELAAAISEKVDLSVEAGQELLNIIVDEITLALSRNQNVSLIGFGSFSCQHRAARQGRHPSTGQTIDIDACKAVVFRPGKKLKECVNHRAEYE
ncbi:MAG: HU family DNA-binding protein [Pseudomonadales bacterium]|nr:HU family DNA-binding protein [Pseudomonadales bacterium]